MIGHESNRTRYTVFTLKRGFYSRVTDIVNLTLANSMSNQNGYEAGAEKKQNAYSSADRHAKWR